MANLTKAEREKLEAKKEAEIRAEIEAKLRAEYEEKLKTVTIGSQKNNSTKKGKGFMKIPLDTVVPVVCNTVGGLTYISKKSNGYIVEWDGLGTVEYMELAELVSLRNTDRRFFEDNWIIIEDVDHYSAIELYEFLKVSKYYECIFTPDTIDTIFDMEPNDIIRTVAPLTSGMKTTIATRAKQKIDSKELADNNKIEALEKSLDVTLVI